MWLACNNGVYNTGGVHETKRRTQYLLEGLEFNRIFAPDIYFGIVPILSERKLKYDVIECGPLIRNPEITSLDCDRPYALVMKRLDEGWRLDPQLYSGLLGNKRGMEFIAQEIANMHKRLKQSPANFGTPEGLMSKLRFNGEFFHEALDQLPAILENSDLNVLRRTDKILEHIGIAYSQSFNVRHNYGYIKRCHGDLKASNLWIPSNGDMIPGRVLFLDCVDFNPEFCNIDTLSDVAMLAIDLEMRLGVNLKDRGKQLARHFLNTYLQVTNEKSYVWPILEYYMTEKAIVCAYMSILFDGTPTLGEKYLRVALNHTHNLIKYLPPKVSKNITKPLAFTASETTPCG